MCYWLTVPVTSVQMMELSKQTVVIVGFIVEAILCVVFFVWAYYTGFRDAICPSWEDMLWGVGLSIPPLIFNYLLFEVAGSRVVSLRFLTEFVEHVVKPLASVLDWCSGLIVAVCAGVGEELFFRGVLQNEFGLIAASVLFSLLHFGIAVKDYLFIAVLYMLIGLYLGVVYQIFGTLWVPILVHISYDYLALLYLRYLHCR